MAHTTGFELPKPGTYRTRIIEIVKHPALNEDWGPQLLIKLILARINKSVNQHDVSSSKPDSLTDAGPSCQDLSVPAPNADEPHPVSCTYDNNTSYLIG